MMRQSTPPSKKCGGFSLMEVLVASAILILVLGFLMTFISHATQTWQRSEARKNRQIAARIALTMLKNDLQAAILLPSGDNRLQFILNPPQISSQYRDAAFWQTLSSNRDGDLYEVGYFVQWPAGRDAGELCRFRTSAVEADSIVYQEANWLTGGRVNTNAPGSTADPAAGLVMDHVLGLWIRLADHEGNWLPENYDSRTSAERPASAEISLIVIDAQTARRISNPEEIQSWVQNASDAASFMNVLKTSAPAVHAGSQVFQTRVCLNIP